MSNTKRIMEQAQAFASAWSLVGGAFDGGDGKERAEEEKAELQRMVEELETALNAIPSSDNTIDGLSQYVEKLESHLAALENQKPVFWYRPHSDGQGYDGPIHDSQIEPVRRESGAWNPLFSSPVPRVRIEWLIEGKSGHGEWFPSHSRTTLADYCKVMDDSYGTGSHRVVDEPYSPVTAPVRLTDEQLADAACNANSSFRAIETAVLRANGFSVDQPDCAGAGRAKQRQDKFVQALRYIAWESGSYAEAVQHAKEAIADTGAIPTPPCAGHAKEQEADESAAPTYSYSSDGEGFIGHYASPEEAAADHLNDNPDDEAVDVGQNERRTARNYVGQYHIESLLEMVAENAYEECGDCAESWLSDLTKDTEQIKELKQVVGDWIQRKEPPGFWHVDFIRRITLAELIASGHLDQPAEAGG